MNTKCKVKSYTKDILTGEKLLTISVESDLSSELDVLQGKELQAEIKPYKKRRSRNANAYMWELCTEISEATGISKEDVYRETIRQMNVYRDFPPMTEKEARTFQIGWGKLGTGWMTEQVDYAEDGERKIIRAYFGSSTYNTKQMSRLIDLLVQEAEELGITVISDKERALLVDEWKGAI